MNSAISDELIDILSIPGIIKNGKYYHQIYKTLIVGKDLLPITTASMIATSGEAHVGYFENAKESIINNIGKYKGFLNDETLIDTDIKEDIMRNLNEIQTQIQNESKSSNNQIEQTGGNVEELAKLGGRPKRINKKIGQHLLKNGTNY